MAEDDWRSLLDRYLYEIAVALQPVIDDISMKLKPNLAACEYAEIDSVPNKMKKVEKLVNSVRSRDLATFNKFCEIVEGCGHKNLAQKLRGKELTLTGEQAFNILRKNYVRLQESLPVNDIFPELFAKAVILESEFLALQNEPNEVKQRRQLATYLLTSVRRRESNFQIVCDILLKTAGVEDLGRTLQADAKLLLEEN